MQHRNFEQTDYISKTCPFVQRGGYLQDVRNQHPNEPRLVYKTFEQKEINFFLIGDYWLKELSFMSFFIVVYFWLLGASVVVYSYSSIIVSSLTAPSMKPSINSYEDLISSSDIRLVITSDMSLGQAILVRLIIINRICMQLFVTF